MDNEEHRIKELEARFGQMLDHDLLTTVATKVEIMSENVKQICSTQTDHEKRLTVIETTWGTVTKLLLIIVPTVSAFVAWFVDKLTRN